jgi:hypothetical protein
MPFNEPYAESCVQEFLRWQEQQLVQPDGYPPFIPEDLILQHLEHENSKILKAILKSAFPTEGSIQLAKNISSSCLRAFCILLEIGKLQYLQSFLDTPELGNRHLPFYTKPTRFPISPASPTFFFEFYAAQWKYCPIYLEYMLCPSLVDTQPLPFTQKTRIGRGADSKTYKIEVAQCYNWLEVCFPFELSYRWEILTRDSQGDHSA